MWCFSGWGGSSLAPEVFQRSFGHASGYPALSVLDSTHPAAVQAVEDRVDLPRTLFLVSSKSGATTESLSFFRYFWQKLSWLNKTPGRHFIAITDLGTPLEKLARERGFRRVFQAPADVGGRYSALTVFGLVPAALIGVDVHRLLDRAWRMAEASAFCVTGSENPGLALGATLGELALAGRDKVTFLASSPLAALPAWIEQLIAESTGKDGKGILPIADEPARSPQAYGQDRLFVSLRLAGDPDADAQKQLAALEAAGHPVVRLNLAEMADLGQEFFRWGGGGRGVGSRPGYPPLQPAGCAVSQRAGPEGNGTAERQGGESEQRSRAYIGNAAGKARSGGEGMVGGNPIGPTTFHSRPTWHRRRRVRPLCKKFGGSWETARKPPQR